MDVTGHKMAFRALLGAHGILLLVSLACIVQLGTQSEEERLENAYSNITGNPMGVLVRFLEANFYPATEFDPIPVFPINPPGTPQYKIKRCRFCFSLSRCNRVDSGALRPDQASSRRCKRVDVMNCTRGEYEVSMPLMVTLMTGLVNKRCLIIYQCAVTLQRGVLGCRRTFKGHTGNRAFSGRR